LPYPVYMDSKKFLKILGEKIRTIRKAKKQLKEIVLRILKINK